MSEKVLGKHVPSPAPVYHGVVLAFERPAGGGRLPGRRVESKGESSTNGLRELKN